MAIQPGKFENVLLKSTTMKEFHAYIGKIGRLLIFPNNYIVFEIGNQTFPLFAPFLPIRTRKLLLFLNCKSRQVWVSAGNFENPKNKNSVIKERW